MLTCYFVYCIHLSPAPVAAGLVCNCLPWQRKPKANKKAQLTQRSARDSAGIVAPPGESEYNSQHPLLAKFREKSNVQQFKVMQGR